MPQLWKGRFKKELAKETNDFNSSISFDSRMFEEDIKGSIAHATMLGATGIIDKSESEKIVAGLSEILADIKSGKLDIDIQGYLLLSESRRLISRLYFSVKFSYSHNLARCDRPLQRNVMQVEFFEYQAYLNNQFLHG